MKKKTFEDFYYNLDCKTLNISELEKEYKNKKYQIAIFGHIEFKNERYPQLKHEKGGRSYFYREVKQVCKDHNCGLF